MKNQADQDTINKNCYSYKDCLVYFRLLIEKNKKKKFFLSDQQLLDCSLIELCMVSPAVFWANFQLKNISSLEYSRISEKINSYLFNQKPTPYLNEQCSFAGLQLKIREGVFIPQADTELLTKTVLFLSEKIFTPEKKRKVFEIGFGSGNISLTLALQKNNWEILAVDVNPKALSLAKENAALLNVSNVKFALGDRFLGALDKYDIIVSNPPYLSFHEYESLDSMTKKQPREALLAGNNGYFFYEDIVKKASHFVEEKFLIAFEIGHRQRKRVVKIILKNFPNAKVEIFEDFGGKTRVVAFYQ